MFLGFNLGLNRSYGGNPLAAYALALDFKNSAYWSGGTQAASLSAMPGYSYTRTGAVSYYNGGTSGDVIDDFAANVPPIISGIGYEAYGAATNLVQQSLTLDNAYWTKTNLAVTADAAAAPDGTTTADKLLAAAGNTIHWLGSPGISVTAGAVYTAALFVRKGDYRYLWFGNRGTAPIACATFDLQTGAVVGSSSATGYIIDCGAYWRVVLVLTQAVGQTVASFIAAFGSSAHTSDYAAVNLAGTEAFYLWAANLCAGSFPDGGPIIATTTAAASIGDQTLSVSLANGTYSAVYTFSDGTTQTIPTTISAGAFTMPAYPATLNKPAVSLVTVN